MLWKHASYCAQCKHLKCNGLIFYVSHLCVRLRPSVFVIYDPTDLHIVHVGICVRSRVIMPFCKRYCSKSLLLGGPQILTKIFNAVIVSTIMNMPNHREP